MTHFGGTIMIGCCVPFSFVEGEVDVNVVACEIISEAERWGKKTKKDDAAVPQLQMRQCSWFGRVEDR
eukprot:scaffold108193_cov70-Cyclotella_meneghiniana.AAC.4